MFTIDCPHVRLKITVHRRLSPYHLAPMLFLRNQPDPIKSLRAMFGNHATVDRTEHCAPLHIEQDGFLDVAELSEERIV